MEEFGKFCGSFENALPDVSAMIEVVIYTFI